MPKIYLLGVFAVITIVILLVYVDSKDVEIIQQTFTSLKQEITKFPDGSTITYLVPEQPQSQKITPSKTITEKASAENATTVDKAVEKIVTPEPNITQYSKSNTNGVVISGYILLIDSNTRENVKPYKYKVLISIICDQDKNMIDGFNFCSTDPIFGRKETSNAGKDEDGKDQGGFYEYIWHPKGSDSSAFYDVTILVTSDQRQLDGTYRDYTKSYKIQVL